MKLSKREKDVLDLLKNGASNETAAERLGISKNAVSVNCTRVRRKIEQARQFLSYIAQYKNVLQRRYEDIDVTTLDD